PSHHPHPPFLFSHPPSTTPIYTLSLHDALPISIHRIASTYDVLPASVPLGRGVFVDGIRALDVTGDGIKEAVVTHGDDGSAGTVHVDVLRWVGGTESFRRIFAMALSDRGGPPCAYRFVPAANGQDIEAIVPV